jgi:CrcB protein
MNKILLVAIGGAIGSIIRYLIGDFMKSEFQSVFPWHTLFVNLSGCLLIGIAWGYLSQQPLPDWFSAFIVIGFLGGFTTFSSYGLEGLQLLLQKSYVHFFLYLFSTNVIGISFTYIGYKMSSMLAA